MAKNKDQELHLDGDAYKLVYDSAGVDGVEAVLNAYNLREPFLVRGEGNSQPVMQREHLEASISNIINNPTPDEAALFAEMDAEGKRAYAEAYARDYASKHGIQVKDD